ncbi:hypothetical protein Slit_2470 [Sideroxydans lithotrophicus ES-1]|uniref:Uncharacterized protein n=1 Tax=Sideroxydans lithotrophicus (strain ES-1) TaxID=580332 RepID=D5CMM3_SIDLE|nr:hypothetical protein Slit_2470 [Sideroxydans lithotrophicus ES-1]
MFGWIPAFAGMTAAEDVCVMNYGKIKRSRPFAGSEYLP